MPLTTWGLLQTWRVKVFCKQGRGDLPRTTGTDGHVGE